VIDDADPERLVAGATELSTGVGALTLVGDEGGRRGWYARTAPDADLADDVALICAVGILGVVRSLGPERFRPCAAPTCSGAFIDTTRPGRRRYCMPDICGNRINVANHRARRHR
jgi:predicted RNA-binding Zn ribbon-like protein